MSISHFTFSKHDFESENHFYIFLNELSESKIPHDYKKDKGLIEVEATSDDFYKKPEIKYGFLSLVRMYAIGMRFQTVHRWNNRNDQEKLQ